MQDMTSPKEYLSSIAEGVQSLLLYSLQEQ